MPKPLLVAAALLSTGALVGSALQTPAAAASGWSPPTPLASSVTNFALAGSTSGTEAASWTTSSQTVAAVRTPGSAWLRHRVGSETGNASVAADGRGDVVVTHGESAAYRTAGPTSPWQDDALASGGDALGSTLAMASNATEVVVGDAWWEEGYGEGVDAYIHAPNGTWRDLSSYPRGVALALTDQDALMAVRPGYDGDNVYASVLRHRSDPAQWRQVIEGANTRPRVAADGAGDVVVATASDGGLRTVYKRAGRRWQGSHVVVGSAPVSDVALGIGESGTATVAYVSGTSPAHVMAMSRTATGRWSEPVALSGPLPAPYGVDVAADARGNVAVIWSTDSTGGDDTVQVALRPQGQDWQPTTQIAGPNAADSSNPSTNLPPKVVAAGGRFTAAYVGDGVLQYRDLVMDATAPAAHVSGLGEHELQPRFEVHWRATDDFAVSGVDVRVRPAHQGQRRLSSWSRWLTNTTRSSKAFRGDDGTTYCFSVRAHDAVGNIGHWSRARCTTLPLDDRDADVVRGWAHQRSHRAFRRTLSTTKGAGHQLIWRGVQARTLEILAQTCRRCGTISVRQGHRHLGVFHLHSPRVRNKRVMLAGHYRRVVRGPVVIRVVSHGKPVRIDGIIAER